MEIAAGIKGARRRWWHDEDEWWDSGKERETHISRLLLHRRFSQAKLLRDWTGKLIS